jgi:thymidylate synthase ThyX
MLKHRISSMNAESARYKELKEDKYYIPEDWMGVKTSEPLYFDSPTTTLEPTINTFDGWTSALEEYTRLGNRLYHQCVDDLTPTLGRKRAKESARFFKTYNSQIQGDVSFNMRSFANFQKLRNSDHSQLEIKKIAQQMLELVQNIDGEPFKHTLEAFNGGTQ